MIWYNVSFNENTVFLDVNPPDGEEWKAQFQWNDIIRVCFQVGDLWESDDIYIFTNKRPESYVIPTEANGSPECWGEIIRRDLFDAELAIKIASATEGLYCWPED
ncbi:hypothetical protein [Candidatus Borrarchaeum sp.]|uniref:hypothetical protein n=1 Tax=Candidatus Borrarchaeum sp. TaxID=2846742 RepID=UPI002580F9E4|nr:hypothetical protein [Candidatus Borrarchaeum sp.]